MKQKFYYTYVLISDFDGEFYVGWADDLRARVDKHNDGQVLATQNRRPLRLVYYEACINKELAIAREKTLKTGFGRKYIRKRTGL